MDGHINANSYHSEESERTDILSFLYLQEQEHCSCMRFTFLVILLLAAVWLAAATREFCSNSVADPKVISPRLFKTEERVFLKAYKWFQARTKNANLNDPEVLAAVAEDLIVFTENNVPIANASFIVVRSTGAIIIDTSFVPPVNPPEENHNTRYSNLQSESFCVQDERKMRSYTPVHRYEVGKAILCREFKTLVFNHYFVSRLNQIFRFYAKALQTSTDFEWFTFRINIPFTTFPATCDTWSNSDE